MKRNILRIAAATGVVAVATLLAGNFVYAQQSMAKRHRIMRSAPVAAPVAAPAATDEWQLPNKDQVNEGTVTMMTGPVGGLTPIMGSDLARVLDDGEKLRVLPIAGKGSVQGIIDMLMLKTVDMGFIVSDAAEFFKTQYNVPNIDQRLRYIAKLYNNDIYIIAPSSIKTIYDLAGKRVMAPKDLGYFSAKNIFTRLGIEADLEYRGDELAGLQNVIDGKADAWIVSVGKIFPVARNLKNDDHNLHLVPIPYEKSLRDIYLPSWFTSEEYPNLIAPGEEVSTLAASNILATFNWPENTDRYRKVARFTEAFFSKNAEFLKPPRNPKWQDMNLSENVLGWTRFKPAQDWLDQHAPAKPTAAAATLASATGSTDDFKQFLQERGYGRNRSISQDEMIGLLKTYTEWAKTRR